jgi:hypothetical protein
MAAMDLTLQEMLEPWQRLRRKLSWQWTGYLAVRVISGSMLLASYVSPRGSNLLLLLAVMAFLALRRMWLIDRQIVAVDRTIAEKRAGFARAPR